VGSVSTADCWKLGAAARKKTFTGGTSRGFDECRKSTQWDPRPQKSSIVSARNKMNKPKVQVQRNRGIAKKGKEYHKLGISRRREGNHILSGATDLRGP